MRFALPSALRTKKAVALGVASIVAVGGLGINAGTAEAAGANCHAKVLKVGSSGQCVMLLQMKLETTGQVKANFNANNYFGDYTRSKVIEFQGKKGLKADGIVGKKTWNALGVHQNGSMTSQRGPVDNSSNYNDWRSDADKARAPKPSKPAAPTAGRGSGPGNGGGNSVVKKTASDTCKSGDVQYRMDVTYNHDTKNNLVRITSAKVTDTNPGTQTTGGRSRGGYSAPRTTKTVYEKRDIHGYSNGRKVKGSIKQSKTLSTSGKATKSQNAWVNIDNKCMLNVTVGTAGPATQQPSLFGY